MSIAIAEDWAAIKEAVAPFVGLDTALPWEPTMEKKYPSPALGWNRWENDHWEPFAIDELPQVVALDIESSPSADGWRAVLAIARCPNYWYCWTGYAATIPFPPSRVLIGHDVVRHDLRFLSCTYSHPGRTLCLDTRTMGAIANGIPEKVRDLWTKFNGRAKAGKGAHPWMNRCTQLDLEAMVAYFLGRCISKDIQETHKDTPFKQLWDYYEPRTLIGYCCQDVAVTIDLFGRLSPVIEREVMPNPVALVGMVRASAANCLVRVKEVQEIAEQRLRDAQSTARAIVRNFALELLKREGQFKDSPSIAQIDWGKLKSGPDKGSFRWFRDLGQAEFSCESKIAIQILGLTFRGVPVVWRRSTFVAGHIVLGRIPYENQNVKSCWLDSSLALGALAKAREALIAAKRIVKLASELHVVDGIAKLPARPGNISHMPTCPLFGWVLENAHTAIVAKNWARHPASQLPTIPPSGPIRTELLGVLPPEGLTEWDALNLSEAWQQWWAEATQADAVYAAISQRPGQRLLGVHKGFVIYEGKSI